MEVRVYVPGSQRGTGKPLQRLRQVEGVWTSLLAQRRETGESEIVRPGELGPRQSQVSVSGRQCSVALEGSSCTLRLLLLSQGSP